MSEHGSPGAGPDVPLDRSTVVALVAMALGVFVIANDFTALSVAVAPIEEDLDTTLNRAQWVINAYTVVFGVLIVTGGRVADLVGRRRTFLIGATIFAGFSALGALAPTIDLLIAARAGMGIGGAMVWPAVLGMIYALLPEERAGLAGGLIIAVAGLGNAMGPLIAGALTDALSWRWIFVVNVPVAAVAMFATWRNVAESEPGEQVGFDWRGVATLSLAVIALLVGLDVGSEDGFGEPVVIGCLLAGLVLFLAFVRGERRTGSSALVPRRVTASRRFTGALLSVVLLSAIYFGVLLYVPQFTQRELGWSALAAGAGLLPLMLVFAVTSWFAGTWYDRLGARLLVGGGAACLTVGVGWLGIAVATGSGYAVLVPGLVVAGVGVGAFYSAITTAAVTALDASDASLAGGIIYMGNVAGGSLGLGLNTAIVLSAASLVDGIRAAFLVDAAMGAVGTVVAVVLVGGATGRFHPLHRRHTRAHG
jgi:EmrB/QacA subfamily drug resistance transporter